VGERRRVDDEADLRARDGALQTFMPVGHLTAEVAQEIGVEVEAERIALALLRPGIVIAGVHAQTLE